VSCISGRDRLRVPRHGPVRDSAPEHADAFAELGYLHAPESFPVATSLVASRAKQQAASGDIRLLLRIKRRNAGTTGAVRGGGRSEATSLPVGTSARVPVGSSSPACAWPSGAGQAGAAVESSGRRRLRPPDSAGEAVGELVPRDQEGIAL
jgi:hypothetical protein